MINMISELGKTKALKKSSAYLVKALLAIENKQVKKYEMYLQAAFGVRCKNGIYTKSVNHETNNS